MTKTVDAVVSRVENTTDGQSGSVAVPTGTRLYGEKTVDQGTGLVDARRFVDGEETTLTDPGDVITSSFGLSGVIVTTSFPDLLGDDM